MLLSILFAAETTTPPMPSDPAGFNWNLVIVFGGVMMLVFTMPRILRRTLNERRLLEKQCNREIADHVAIKNQTDKIMLELVEAGREINAQLDTKMRLLNRLIRDAEAVAERLEKFSDGTIGANVAPRTSSANNEKPIAAPPMAAQPFTPEKIAPADDNSESGRWRLDTRKKIENYYRENRQPAEIARLLRLSLSEVNLVLDMLSARRQ